MSTNESPHSLISEAIPSIAFGLRLKSAREAMGWDEKDVANQLRLSEEIITMLEKEAYPDNLPVTFIRGYIRSYGKLLQIPETEISKAIEPLKHKPVLISHTAPTTTFNIPFNIPLARDSYLIHLLTYLVVFTIITLALMWWFNVNPTQTIVTKNEVPLLAIHPSPQNIGSNITHEANISPNHSASTQEIKSNVKLTENTLPTPSIKAQPKIKMHDEFDETEFIDAE